MPDAGDDPLGGGREGAVLNLHAILPRSHANGPGARMALWFQGCSLGCPGCFNPDTHSAEPRLVLPVGELLARVAAEGNAIEGVSISGGEPLQQPVGLLALLEGVRTSTALSVLLFSGCALDEIRQRPLGLEILAHVDVLIAGRYVASRRQGHGLLGSANQHVHLLTERYTLEDVRGTPAAEVQVAPDGTVIASGVAPLVLGR